MKGPKRRAKHRVKVPPRRAQRIFSRRGESRRFPRSEQEWEVILEEPGSRPKKGKLSGLNPFGAKLRLRAKQQGPPEGTAVQLRFSPARGEPPMTIKGLVWRTDRDGQAIVFVNLSSDDFVRLRALVGAPARAPA